MQNAVLLNELCLSAGFEAAFFLPAEWTWEDTRGSATLLLLIASYIPRQENAAPQVHPYYPISQQAYHNAAHLADTLNGRGLGAVHLPHIHVKPLLNRIAGIDVGRNTLNYCGAFGSRFHVQLLGINDRVDAFAPEGTPTDGCGSCRRCMDACPGGAITPEGFLRENCLRDTMLSGKAMPLPLREKNGGRLLGCDICQAVCPRNKPVSLPGKPFGNLRDLLTLTDARPLGEVLGYNLALKNRIIAQACLIAGCSGDASLLPLLDGLTRSGSPTVVEHARWAIEQLQK